MAMGQDTCHTWFTIPLKLEQLDFFAILTILKKAWIEIYGCILVLANSCMDASIVGSTGPRSKNTMCKYKFIEGI
jgi:hypothetical protein